MSIDKTSEYERDIRETQIKTLREQLTRILSQLPDDVRLQRKYETLTAIMEGEGANASANIWVTLMADFAIACSNFGFEPKKVLLNISADARKMVDAKLKEQGLTLTAPDAKPN